MTIYVYSTLTNDQAYTIYSVGANGVPQMVKTINIKGGSNRADKRFHTPLGVATAITEDDLALLKGCELFQIHEANGYITYDTEKRDAEKVATEMEGRDESAPLVAADFIAENVDPPVSNGTTDEAVEVAPKTSRRRGKSSAS